MEDWKKDTATKNVTEQPDAIERIVCEPMMEAIQNFKPLSKDESKLLITLITSELDAENEDSFDELHKAFMAHSLPLKIFLKRIESSGFKIKTSKRVQVMMSSIMNTPGDAVMYACYFMKHCKDKKTYDINLSYWSTDMFAMGIFSDDDIERIYYGQKVERAKDGAFNSDNLIDYPVAFTSLKREVNEES